MRGDVPPRGAGPAVGDHHDPRPPTVLFVDTAGWDTFFQLAARLRRNGCRVVRLSTTRGSHHRLVSRLVFHRFVEVADAARLTELGDLVAGERIVDVQSVESLRAELHAGLDGCAPDDVRRSVGAQLALLDKVEAADYMRGRGADVPDTMPLDGRSTAQTVIDRLGLPVVVKPRVGASGSDVHIVRAADVLAEVLASMAGEASGYYAERFVAGEGLSYGAVVGPDGVEQEMVTRAWRSRPGLLGPPSGHETIEAPELVERCRRVVTIEGYRGPVQIDVIRDADGTSWLHDLNLRVWGDFGSALQAGIDLTAGYLHVIGVRPDRPVRRTTDPGIRYATFPTDVAEELSAGHAGRAAGCVARAAVPFTRWFGARYMASEAVSLVLLVHYLVREAVRSRRSGRRP